MATKFQFSNVKDFDIQFPPTCMCPEGAHYRLHKSREELRSMVHRITVACDNITKKYDTESADGESMVNEELLDLIDEILEDSDASEKILVDKEYDTIAAVEVLYAIIQEAVNAFNIPDTSSVLPAFPAPANRGQRRAQKRRRRKKS